MNALPDVHMFWIGPRLGPLEIACLQSFLAVGHPVILHVYDRPEGVPSGVILRDAEETIPRHKIIRHSKTGSYSLFSNTFRYQLLRNGADLYADCDVFCLRPIPRADYIFGYETDTQINGAVLALPAESPLLQKLSEISRDPRFVPPWLPKKKQKSLRWAMRFGMHPGTPGMAWGTLGPRAITHYAHEVGVAHRAQPMDVFYPVDSRRIGMLYDAELTLADITTHRTLCIHLYNEMLRQMGRREIPPSSPLGRLLQNDVERLPRAG